MALMRELRQVRPAEYERIVLLLLRGVNKM